MAQHRRRWPWRVTILLVLGAMFIVIRSECEAEGGEHRQGRVVEHREARLTQARSAAYEAKERERESLTRQRDEAIEARENEAKHPGFLGVEVANVTETTMSNNCEIPNTGVLILRTEPGGPAAQAGIHGAAKYISEKESNNFVDRDFIAGNVIVQLDDRPIPDTDVLLADLAQRAAEETVSLETIECGAHHTVYEVTLSATTHIAEEAAQKAAAQKASEVQRESKEAMIEEERQREGENPRNQSPEEREYNKWLKNCEVHPEKQGCGGE